jgi:hypothetical protein
MVLIFISFLKTRVPTCSFASHFAGRKVRQNLRGTCWRPIRVILRRASDTPQGFRFHLLRLRIPL